MLLRHEKELEQVKRVNQQKEEELIKRQQVGKLLFSIVVMIYIPQGRDICTITAS